jgi:hypothetical protein
LAVEPNPQQEYYVKARIIRFLLDYVEWPTGDAGRPIVVGVLEPSPFEGFLEQALSKVAIKGRPVQLRSLRGLSQIANCDVVFIPEASEENLDSILGFLRGKSVLTIGDTPGYARRGVTVNLAHFGGRTQLEINLARMRNSGLTISPHVLKSATLFE